MVEFDRWDRFLGAVQALSDHGPSALQWTTLDKEPFLLPLVGSTITHVVVSYPGASSGCLTVKYVGPMIQVNTELIEGLAHFGLNAPNDFFLPLAETSLPAITPTTL